MVWYGAGQPASKVGNVIRVEWAPHPGSSIEKGSIQAEYYFKF
jgi:hypothetical protein